MVKEKIKDNAEKGARQAVLEDLFNDFNKRRFSVYKMNFFRGVAFGFGSVLGGTVLIALLVGLLSVTGALVPGTASFIHDVTNTLQKK